MKITESQILLAIKILQLVACASAFSGTALQKVCTNFINEIINQQESEEAVILLLLGTTREN